MKNDDIKDHLRELGKSVDGLAKSARKSAQAHLNEVKVRVKDMGKQLDKSGAELSAALTKASEQAAVNARLEQANVALKAELDKAKAEAEDWKARAEAAAADIAKAVKKAPETLGKPVKVRMAPKEQTPAAPAVKKTAPAKTTAPAVKKTTPAKTTAPAVKKTTPAKTANPARKKTP